MYICNIYICVYIYVHIYITFRACKLIYIYVYTYLCLYNLRRRHLLGHGGAPDRYPKNKTRAHVIKPTFKSCHATVSVYPMSSSAWVPR